MKTLDDAPYLDLFSAEYRENPHAVLDELRRKWWVVRVINGAMVIDRAHVQALLADRRLHSALPDFIGMQGVTDGLLHDRMVKTLLAIDGADHNRVRALVRKAFVPSAVDRHRPLMRSLLESLVEPVVPDGRCEFMATVAEHYPIQVMCHLLGVPPEDHEQFTTWIKAIAWTLSLHLAAHREEAERGIAEMDDYVTALVADRRAHPRDDLVTELVQAEEEGDRLTNDELQSMIIGLLFAGYDTTRNQLGLAMWMFAQHPDQWELLGSQPELAPRAVEEAMRFRAAVSLAPRLVGEDFEFDGYRFTAGTHLSLSTSAANHDSAAYDDPHALAVTAERSEPHLTFGGGPHYCLGAGLARAELQEAFQLLAGCMPDLALDGEPEWRVPMGIFGPETLRVKFRPGGAATSASGWSAARPER